MLFVAAGRHRRAMRHAGNHVQLDNIIARAISPDPPRISVDHFLERGFVIEAMHVNPLFHDLIGIFTLDHRIGAAVPDRKARPRPPVRRCCAYQITPFAARTGPYMNHALQRLVDGRRRAERQARDHCATRKQLRIRSEHDASHRSACREAGDEYASAVDAVLDHHRLNHLPDRLRLALPALGVAGKKPVEAVVWIVGDLLLGKHEREAVAIRLRGPAGAQIVARRRLSAAVKYNHERGAPPRRRNILEHAQGAGIGPEFANFNQIGECRTKAQIRPGNAMGRVGTRFPSLAMLRQKRNHDRKAPWLLPFEQQHVCRYNMAIMLRRTIAQTYHGGETEFDPYHHRKK